MKFLKISSFVFIATIIILGCKKPAEGYLSKVLVYSPKTLVATKGRATTSAALLVDGSTSPINVELLTTRNYYTKQSADAILLKEYEIVTYTAEITQNDSTPEQVAAKVGKAMYSSFNVNPIGGRLEVTPATNFIDTGTYEFDILVTNPAGSREVNSVGIIKIVNPTNSFEITTQSVNTSPSTSETPTTNQTNFTTSIVRTSSAANKIILKFVDKNGVPFNPNAGQVNIRADQPYFKMYAPFYPEEKTDTALVYRYPSGLPVFPIYPALMVPGRTQPITNYSFSYRIPATATDINMNVNPTMGFRLWPLLGEQAVSGTYLVTFKMNFVTRKP
ncbi:MAG TPA: hypothetical protein VGQ09_23240 [Chitinophagaceae bacterium]|jgi:hypothetical protein|nr:hypothetical protein [Chitinophagaceae bacterium]